MWTLVTQFPFVQRLSFWVLLLILLSAFISQCRREQRLIPQGGCAVIVLSHSLLVAGPASLKHAGHSGRGKVSQKRTEHPLELLPLHCRHISLVEASHMMEPDSQGIQFSSWEWGQNSCWRWKLASLCFPFVLRLRVGVSCPESCFLSV